MRRPIPSLALLCPLLLAAPRALAELPKTDTFFPSGEGTVGSYLSPELRFNTANEQFGVWIGGRFALVFSSAIAVGAQGYGLVTDAEADRPAGERLSAGMGGGFVELLFDPHERVHTTLGILLGAGSAVAEDPEDVSRDEAYGNSFFIMEPEFGLEYNLTRGVRFCPALSFRWISGTVAPLDSKWDLSDTSLIFRIKFGNFEGRDPSEFW